MTVEKQLETYLRKIITHFPEVPFDNARLITTGWDNDVVILDDKVVFRFPKRDEYKDRFKAEVRLLRYLAPRMPVHIPDYIYTPYDLSFGGYTMLQGVEMTPDVFGQLDDVQQEAVAEQLGGFLSVMHETPIEVAKDFGFEEEEGGYCWSRSHTERTLTGLMEKVFPELDPEEVKWIEHQFTRYLSLSFDFQISVIHSDFVGDHIFIDPTRGVVSGVIDFGDTEFSDSALDFGGMWEYGERFPQQILNNYEHKIDADFLERSKFPLLADTAGNMLQLEEDAQLPVTFESSRAELNKRMASSLSL